MEREKEVAVLSIPFAAGVAAGSIWISSGHNCGSVLLLSSSVLLIFLNSRKTSGLFLLSVLFLSLGLFCYISRQGPILHNPLQKIVSYASAWKLSFSQIIDNIDSLSTDSASIVKALMTGDKSTLGRDTLSHFRDSGASHILALSGMHLGIIYLITRQCLSALGNSAKARVIRATVVITFCFLYTIMTGAGPSITRAFLFISTKEILGLTPRRTANSRTILPAVLTLHLAMQPDSIDSVSFQLSYLAMAGLVWIAPAIQNWYPSPIREKPVYDPFRRLWDTFCTSISCQLTTAPVAWLHFHCFPKYFLLANIIALPLTEGIIILSVLLTVFSLTGVSIPLLAALCSKLVSWLLRSMEIISVM